jgi:hypothetical protein
MECGGPAAAFTAERVTAARDDDGCVVFVGAARVIHPDLVGSATHPGIPFTAERYGECPGFAFLNLVWVPCNRPSASRFCHPSPLVIPTRVTALAVARLRESAFSYGAGAQVRFLNLGLSGPRRAATLASLM